MKLGIIALLTLLLISCAREPDCVEVRTLEGEVTINNEVMNAAFGTGLSIFENDDDVFVVWSIVGIEQSCEFINQAELSTPVAHRDSLEGTFEFSKEVQGRLHYDGVYGNLFKTMNSCVSGSFTVEKFQDGIYTISMEALDPLGEPLSLFVRYKFR